MEFYYHATEQDILILSADGGLSSHTAEQFVDELAALIESGMSKLIVDCTRLGYISSYGMSVLIRLNAKLSRIGGDVKLAGVQGAVASLLRRTRLDTVFEMYPDVEAAKDAFGSAEGTSGDSSAGA